MPESIELIQTILGLDPYVLVEPTVHDDGDESINIRAGGGVDTKERIAVVLLLALEGITGVPTDLYQQQVDTARIAAGLPPLEQAASRA